MDINKAAIQPVTKKRIGKTNGNIIEPLLLRLFSPSAEIEHFFFPY